MISDSGRRNLGSGNGMRREELSRFCATHGVAIAKAYLDEGLSHGAIARRIGCPETRVREALKRAGVTMRLNGAGMRALARAQGEG